MKTFFPAPTLYKPEKITGRDFLGQQSIIQYMADRCLPSFTNATKKARYYTFWAWAFKMLQRYGDSLNEKEKWWYLLKLETALIIINKHLRPDMVGMPGVTGIGYETDEILAFEPDTHVTIYSEKIRATSYAAVQYAPSLGSLNIVKKFGTNQYAILKYGQELSEVFDNQVNLFSGYKILTSPKTKKIEWKYLLEMRQSFSLDIVPDNEKETLTKIIEQKTRTITAEENKSERVETTLLLLDLIKKERIRETPELLIKLWNGYCPPEPLREIADGWKVVEARRYYQLSIEAILSSFCQYLVSFSSHIGNFEEFSDDVIEKLKEFNHNKSAQLPFRDVIRKNKLLGDFIDVVDSFCRNNFIDEQVLTELIKKHSGSKVGFNYQLPHYGLILLLYLYNKFDYLKALKTEKAAYFWKIPANYRHSLGLTDKLIQKWSKLPVSIGLNHIIHQLSLKLHLGVSQDKWLQTGNFTFRFVKAEPTGFQYLATMTPNMTSNKILAYTQVLINLGFINDKGDYLTVTKAGDEFFKKY